MGLVTCRMYVSVYDSKLDYTHGPVVFYDKIDTYETIYDWVDTHRDLYREAAELFFKIDGYIPECYKFEILDSSDALIPEYTRLMDTKEATFCINIRI